MPVFSGHEVPMNQSEEYLEEHKPYTTSKSQIK